MHKFRDGLARSLKMEAIFLVFSLLVFFFPFVCVFLFVVVVVVVVTFYLPIFYFFFFLTGCIQKAGEGTSPFCHSCTPL